MLNCKERLRRTMMFVPGNSPKMINSADVYGADSIMFDIEDSIAITQKDAARLLVAQALQAMQFTSETVVRINHPTQTPYGMADLACILPAKPNMIRLPKVECVEEVALVADEIAKVEQQQGFPSGSIQIIGAIESVKGLYNVREICKGPRMAAIALGAEDFIADLKTQRTKSGIELYFARSQIIMAARDAQIPCMDTVFSDINDTAGFSEEVARSRDMGFDGKSVIHPQQIKIVHELYTPTAEQIVKASKVLAAYATAFKNNQGVIAVDGKMIDGPIVARAQRVIQQAKAAGINVGEEGFR